MCLRTCVSSYGCEVANKTEFLISGKLTEEDFRENPIINWDAILWVNRPTVLWVLQLLLAMVSLTQSLVLTYLGYKVSSEISNCNCCFISNELSSFNYLNHLRVVLQFAGQHLAANTLISLYTRISNDNTLCTNGKFDLHMNHHQHWMSVSLPVCRLCIPRCAIYSYQFSWTVGWPSVRWRTCL